MPKASEVKGWKESKDSQKSSSANATVGVNSDYEGERASAAVAVDEYDSDHNVPDLEAVSDSDSDDESRSGSIVDNDWFSEATDEGEMDKESSMGSNWNPDNLFKDSMPDVNVLFVLEDPSTPELAFVSATNNVDNASCTEVYDSGCTSHISPYRNDLENFVEIQPKAF